MNLFKKSLIVIALTVALTLIFGSCGGAEHCSHRDKDDDSLCDLCGVAYQDGNESSGNNTSGGNSGESSNNNTSGGGFTGGNGSSENSSNSDDYSDDGVVYLISTDGTYAEVVDYTGSSKMVRIAESYEGVPVTSVGTAAFANKEITSVIIPDSVTSIARGAFSGCNSLKDIALPFVGDTTSRISKLAYLFTSSSLSGYDNSNVPASLKTVTLTNATIIEPLAFYSCDGLTSITIGNGVTSIGDGAFSNCTSLMNVTIPNSVTYIGSAAFNDCDSLIEKENGISYVGKWAIDFDNSMAIVSIRKGTVGIAKSTFYGASKLRSINIPDSITSLCHYAFQKCTNLTNVTIPNSIISIGNGTFSGCTSLTSVTIPDNVMSIGDDAFSGCTSLESVYITDIAKWCGISFCDSYANPLYYANNLYLIDEDGEAKSITELVIPADVTSIGDYVFYGCASLTSVTIGNDVTSIGVSAFSGCTGLTNVTIPNSIISIGNGTFSGCTNITTATLPAYAISAISEAKDNLKTVVINGGESIGERMFHSCDNLASVTIDDGVTNIGVQAFLHCDSLTSVTIGDSVTRIDDYAFYGCDNLASVTIGDGVTSIGAGAFDYCEKLVEVINKSSLNITTDSSDYGNVAYYAIEVHTGESKIINYNGYLFYTYEGIKYLLGYVGDNTELTLPESYNAENYEIYERAFLGRDDITSVTIPDSVTSIGNYAFFDCSNLASVNIGNGVTSIGVQVFSYCNGITSITIPDSVTEIRNYAFKYCDSLTSVIFKNPDSWSYGVTSISKTDLSNSSTAATYLKSTYCDYYWFRS